ncbi:two-component response regulator ARR1-like [Andrographis paniculata]|uniref:two-component response regulator ARR1-like n=1 Tax=Andrographis paniculata TaxID=175694 RepID=UPI0021E70E06|nr:two-component response regulator ARR1-like [Andrographis paniculata]
MMDIKGKEVVSLGETRQHTEIKGICVLVVNDDVTCSNIVSEMLRYCNFEVLHVGGFLDVLSATWEIKERLDHVITNVHNLQPNGPVVAHHIEEKLNVHVLLMDHHGEKIKSNGKPVSFAAYFVHGLSMNDLDRLWQYALVKEKSAANQEQNVGWPSKPTSMTVIKNTISLLKKRPREKLEKAKEGKGASPSVVKKPRVVWTAEMHKKFLEAIEIIGYEKAVPKKIVEAMDVPGLTRENVASHLQKFRGSLKRTQEVPGGSLSGGSTAKEFKGLAVLPALSSLYTNIEINIAGDWLQLLNLDLDSRPYDDHVSNMLPRLPGDWSQPNSSAFVGYRLASDGKSIEFGEHQASVDLTAAPSNSAMLLPSDEKLFLAALEAHGDELWGQSVATATFFPSISQLPYSPSSCPQSIQELDALFEYNVIDDN